MSFVGCRHHIIELSVYLDGTIMLGDHALAPDAADTESEAFAAALAEFLLTLPDSCSLDAARADDLTLDEARSGLSRMCHAQGRKRRQT